MTVRERVRRARRALAATVLVAALLWAAVAALSVVLVVAVVQWIEPLPAGIRAGLWPAAVAAALAAAGAVLWRWRTAWSLERVALWIEERQPRLEYALVTAIDPTIAPEDRYPELHARARTAEIGALVRRASLRTLGRALAVLVPLLAAVSLLDAETLLREAGAELARRVSGEATSPPANRLETLRARVIPPAYSGLPEEVVEQPQSVAALVGSRIAFEGDGPAEGVTAVVGPDTLDAAPQGAGRWSVPLRMPDTAMVVAFADREHRRLVVLEPVADSVPAVRLRLPARDTTYQTVPRGRLVVEAEVADDLGLGHGYVEYMLTTGAQESFETKTTRGRRVAFGGARSAVLREVVLFDTLGLEPGAVIHVRAVAYDRNDVTGPGRGVSETRTLRIAEKEDTVSINAAPPLPIDSMWMSQRRLNMLTDTLIQDRPRLEVREFANTSSVYGNRQDEIRERAVAVIRILEDDGVGGTFETQVSRMLREAVDLMYEARVHLGIAQPDSAMPYMIRVLEILDEIRLANRYYLRGVLRPEAVNVERVRLTGEDPGTDDRRGPRSRVEDARARLLERIERALALVGRDPQAAADTLTYVRVRALNDAPELADALKSAIDRLRRGENADSVLSLVRRALEPPPARLDGPVEWGGVP